MELLKTIFVYAAAFVITGYGHIIIHEAGHLVCGLISGYKYVSFRIGNIMLQKENGKLLLKKMKLTGTGGQCLMSPPEMKDGEFPFVLYNVGGWMANLIVSTILMVVYFALDLNNILEIFLKAGISVGFSYAALNGIPNERNDGANIQLIKKSKAGKRAFWIQLKIVEYASREIAVKDMPEEWFELPERNEMDNPMVASIGVHYCGRLMDMGKYEEAYDMAKTLLCDWKVVEGIEKNALVLDMIFCELIGEFRYDVITKMLDEEQQRFMKLMKNFISVIRVNYAYELLVKRDINKAGELKKKFEKVAYSHPYEVDVELERRLIQVVEETAEKRDIKWKLS